MSSTCSVPGGGKIRAHSANKSSGRAGVKGSAAFLGFKKIDRGATNADQNWVEVFDARSNQVGYVLR